MQKIQVLNFHICYFFAFPRIYSNSIAGRSGKHCIQNNYIKI